MEFILDFEFDDDVVKLYEEALAHEFTSESLFTKQVYDFDATKNRLAIIKRRKEKSGYPILGILKIKDSERLCGIAFPRQLDESEYSKYELDPRNNYFRVSGLFIDSEMRGRGIGQKTLQWLIDKKKHVVWTTHTENYASQSTAEKCKLKHNIDYDVLDKEGNVLETLKVYVT